MSNTDQIKAFVLEIQAVCNRFSQEFELPLASAIGALEMVKLGLFEEAMTDDEDE